MSELAIVPVGSPLYTAAAATHIDIDPAALYLVAADATLLLVNGRTALFTSLQTYKGELLVHEQHISNVLGTIQLLAPRIDSQVLALATDGTNFTITSTVYDETLSVSFKLLELEI